MLIQYIKEDGTIFAISQDVEYKKRFHDELIWAEIEYGKEGGFTVRWEDDYLKGVQVASLGEAKGLIEANWSLHKPHSNGSNHEI